MAIKDIAARLGEADKAADRVMCDFLQTPKADRQDLKTMLQQYIALKLQLEGDEIDDSIPVMVRTNISKATGISVEELKQQDKPGKCGSAPAVLAKRILLYIDIQKKMGIELPAMEMPHVVTVQDLTDKISPLLEEK